MNKSPAWVSILGMILPIAALGLVLVGDGVGQEPRPRTARRQGSRTHGTRRRRLMNVLDRLDTILRCRGGLRLEGSIDAHGAKNAALPIMAAAILTNEKVTLHRVPRITDVSVMWSLLEALGARLTLDGANTITIDASNVNTHRAPYALVRKLAASFDLCGPLLGRFGRAEVPLPGGCILGTRATDMHEAAFRALGASVSVSHGFLVATADARDAASAARSRFRTPSVGATKNAMLAAVKAKGTTTICNAAMEPEIVDLANFLIAMGAKITGHGGDTIQVDGVTTLHGVEYDICPDRIQTGTLLLAGAITRGDVTVTRCRPADLAHADPQARRNRRDDHDRRRLDSRASRCGQRRHRHRHRAASRFSDRLAAADAHVLVHDAGHERR